MRGTKAKAMRKSVRDRFKHLAEVPLYRAKKVPSRRSHTGTATQVVLDDRCQRSLYKKMKRAYKKHREYNTPTWRRYLNERSNAAL